MTTETDTKPAHSPEPWHTADCYIFSAYVEHPDGTKPATATSICQMHSPRDASNPNMQRIVSCVNALAGLNPEAVADVVRSFDMLLKVIRISGSALINGHAVKDATAALAKLRQ